MKIEKKLWITLFAFGIFAICFSGWIFRQSTAREKLFWDNTIRCETKELKEGEIKAENIALPKDFDVPKSILFKTTHTIAGCSGFYEDTRKLLAYCGYSRRQFR